MIMFAVLAVAAMAFAAAHMNIFNAAAAEKETDTTGTDTVSVVFTHDMHSHMDSDKTERKGMLVEEGGFGRLKTVFDDINAKYPTSFLIDAGDFSMGTPYQTIFSSSASELRMMGFMGFDAATLGNHEFDYRATGLAAMLNAARGAGPELLCANIDWEATFADDKLKEDAAILKEACDSYGVKDYTVVEHNGLSAAVFGVIGESAVDYAPESGLIFKETISAAEEVVKKIRERENVDIIICLSHCGTVENQGDKPEDSEDYNLAEAVPDIDLIISGHTHTQLDEPIVAGDTYIVSCGSYNRKAGHIVLKRGRNGRYALDSYELVPLDEGILPDKAVEEELMTYRSLVDKAYFNAYGYDTAQVLAANDIEFPDIEEFGLVQGEEPLGNLIADSYRYAVKEAEGTEIDVAIVPHGVIRGSFLKGDVTVSDAFNVSSLGYGKDGRAGYPLVKAYLTGRELKAAAEVDISISGFMEVARLYSSGLEYSWNPNRLILNRAVDVKTGDGNKLSEVEDDRLYSVTADLYSCQMLGAVKDKSMGLLKIEPKDERGNIIEDFEEHIIYDGDRELKAWYALASYIDSFEGDVFPQYYNSTHGRKLLIDSHSPAELFKEPNKIAAIAAGAAFLAAAAAAGTATLAVRRHRRKRRKTS